MIKKSPPTEDISELDQYVFVERIRIRESCRYPSILSILTLSDKETHDRTYYLDIKSEGLRDILRELFRNFKSANLREDKPAVRVLPTLSLMSLLTWTLDHARHAVSLLV